MKTTGFSNTQRIMRTRAAVNVQMYFICTHVVHRTSYIVLRKGRAGGGGEEEGEEEGSPEFVSVSCV